jgi:hypothetical protein
LISERLIEQETLQPTDKGFKTGLRLPWYRALPLSCIERINVTVDGTDVPSESIRFSVGEFGPLTTSEFAPLIDKYWYVLDSAELVVDYEPATEPGSHEVSVEMGLFIPYLPVNGSPLLNLDRCSAELKVAA